MIYAPSKENNEEWAISTFVSIPNQHVLFANVREVLSEFLRDVKHTWFSKIYLCPLSQDYVKFDSVMDKDDLVSHIPHLFDDVHVIFQMHDQGLN